MWSSCRWKASRLQWCYLMCFLADFTANQKKENLSAMIKRFKETQASQIMVAPVAADEVSSYGIADCGGVELKGGDSVKLTALSKTIY